MRLLLRLLLWLLWLLWLDQADYQNKSCNPASSDGNRTCYARSEWRHGLSIWWGVQVSVRGLTIARTGGDGVILGGMEGGGGDRSNAVALTQHVHLSNLTLDSNHRQGLSLINCVSCVIEDCIFSRTSGTKPMAGKIMCQHSAHTQASRIHPHKEASS